jgi:hypothetical protein
MRNALIQLSVLTFVCLGRAAIGDQTDVVNLFDAMAAGQVHVRFIPANSAKANVLIENMTDAVVDLQLPDAIAAVPVLAQLGQNGFGQRGGQNGGTAQGVGGGLDRGMGMQGPGMGNQFGNGGNNFRQGGGGPAGMGMGFMRIAPGKERKVTARTVCLEYGKPDPNPRIAYRMIPIEQFTDDERVARLCRQLGHGQISQKAAQGAAWHLANGLSWQKLAGINRLESKYRGRIRFFSRGQLKAAREIVESLVVPANSSPVVSSSGIHRSRSLAHDAR